MSRHADDLAHLRTVLDSKSGLEVTSFYDHMLRNGHDYAAVSRLFMTAEYSRSGGGADPDAAHLLALHRRYEVYYVREGGEGGGHARTHDGGRLASDSMGVASL